MFSPCLQTFRQRLSGPAGAAVGIETGRSTLRVVALRRRAAGIELAGLAAAPNAVGAGDAPAARVLADTVRRACRSLAWRPRRVVVGVSGAAVFLQTVAVPADADLEETAEAVERIARSLPLPATGVRLAWAPLAAVGGAPSLAGGASTAVGPPDQADAGPAAEPRTLLLVAARREAVLALQERAASSGLGRVLVDIDTFAALRAVCHATALTAAPDRVRILVDAGRDSLRVLAWPERGAPALRVVPVPSGSDPTSLVATVAAAVAGLVGDPCRAPALVELAGGRMLADGVVEALASRLGLPCQLAEPFAALSGGQRPGLVPGAAGALWAGAVGLALRGLA